jgi:hypothetical protein
METYNNNKESVTNMKDIKNLLSGQDISEEQLRFNDTAQEDLKRFLNKRAKTRSYSNNKKITFYNLEIIFKIMNLMAKDREIKWKYHYDTTIDKSANYVLRINLKSFYNKLLRKCREHGYESCFIENKSYDLGRLIKYKEYCLGNFNTRFLREDQSEKKYINSSCTYIDIVELQNLGVDISELLVDNN